MVGQREAMMSRTAKGRVTLGCSRCDLTVCRWRAAALFLANGTPKTGCVELPRPGTSSPGAPQPRVQPAPSLEERVTDLARGAVWRASSPDLASIVLL